MAQAAVTFDLKEIGGLAKLLNDSKLTASERRGLLEDAGDIIQRQTENRFDEQRDPEGITWKELAEKTVEYYRRKFPGRQTRPVLIGKGNLLHHMTFQLNGSDSVIVGSPDVYAAVHQFGYKGIPARPYLGMVPDNIEELERLVQTFIAERL